jgi:hypothetical protein
LVRHDRGDVDLDQRAPEYGAAVVAEHHARVERRDKRVEVSTARGRNVRVGRLLAVLEIGVGNGPRESGSRPDVIPDPPPPRAALSRHAGLGISIDPPTEIIAAERL